MARTLAMAAAEHVREFTIRESTSAKTLSQPASPVEIRKTLLKIVDTDQKPPARLPPVGSRNSNKVWWPSLKRTSSKAAVASASRGFHIDAKDLKIEEQVGEGLRCIVFKGEIKSEKTRVAVKQLRCGYDACPEKAAALVEDLQTLANTLRHPSIVECLGVNLVKERGSVNVVFQHMGGGTLEEYFDARSSEGLSTHVPFHQALGWSIQLFEGLQFLHERDRPIIHRDLKPSALLLSADHKSLKIGDFALRKTADFGIRVFAKRGAEQATVQVELGKLSGVSNKGFTGTARYMAPEIEFKAKEGLKYSLSADVYSAALIMWCMLEGERPWERLHGSLAASVARTGRRPPLRDDHVRYPVRMASVIAQCWDQQPSRRPSARQTLNMLRTMAEEEGCSSPCLPFFVPPRTASASDKLHCLQ